MEGGMLIKNRISMWTGLSGVRLGQHKPQLRHNCCLVYYTTTTTSLAPFSGCLVRLA